MRNYNIITLDAKEMLHRADTFQRDDCKYMAVFRFDLSQHDSLMDRSIIRSVDRYDDAAMFHQIAECLPPSERNGEDCLRNHLVFVDFQSISFAQKKLAETGRSYRDLSEKELGFDDELGQEARLEWMFDPEGGISLVFDDGETRKFVPFDKSNSMARACRISFLDSALKDKLELRLLLGMNFSKIEVNASKYYAYRGLYFSTGCRVEQGEGFCLNEETVLVLPDRERKLSVSNVFAGAGEKPSDPEKELWKFDVFPEGKSMGVNSFDGEGVISPSFARYINGVVKEELHIRRDSHSFQIRMPFTKGMLHEVDFPSFWEEFLGGSFQVRDVFGIRRDLSKVQIILTKSMFKCCSWMKRLFGKEPSAIDPMAYFFEKMRMYGHTMYVTGMDAQQTKEETVKLNYQFLCTLGLTGEEFDTIVERHRRKISIENIIREFRSSDDAMEDDGIMEDTFSIRTETVREKYRKVLGKNLAFLEDPGVRNAVEMMRQGREKDLAEGRLEVLGENRYLSGDLLLLLCHVAEQSEELTKEQQEALRRLVNANRIAPGKFYMPERSMNLLAGRYYALLRNPHLSRNEQCILRPYLAEGSVYGRYFSHLTGVVMTAEDSFVPMILGGADFDGDQVKVIGESSVVTAVKREAFCRQGKQYERKLPIIEIPSLSAKEHRAPAVVPFETIRNTFSNRIGHISNIAVKFARMEYVEDDDAYRNKCAECTIVTGLEIDAAKTGKHPRKNIEELENLVRKEKSVFLEVKEKIRAIYGKGGNRLRYGSFETQKNETKDGTFCSLWLGKRQGKPVLDKIPIYGPDAKVLQVDRLPGTYISYLGEKDGEQWPDYGETMFCFQEEDDWKERLDARKRQAVQQLSSAYMRVMELNRRLSRQHRLSAESDYGGYIHTCLRLQYDSMTSRLFCGVEVDEALRQAYGSIREILSSRADVDRALELLKDRQWHFAPPDKRYEEMRAILNMQDAAEELPKAVVELLGNFREQGYMIFYYILKEVQRCFYEEMDMETYLDMEGGKEARERKFSVPRNNPYWDKLYRICSDGNSAKEERKIWHERVIDQCRANLQDIFSEDMDVALMYAVAEKSKRDFVWNVFLEEEILRNVSEATAREKGGGSYAG